MSIPSSASRITRWAHSVLLAVIVASAALAQQPTFEEEIGVRLVNVEVFVTDKQGNPITGLSEKEFQLLEDGKKVKITHFIELRPQEVSAEIETPAGPESVTSTAKQLILFLDDFAFQPQERSRLVEAMRSYVTESTDEDLHIAVASYDSNLRIHQPLTTDRSLVLAAIDRLSETNPRAAARYAQRQATFRNALETMRTIRDGIDQVSEPGGGTTSDSGRALNLVVREIDALAEEARAENRRAIIELSQLVNALDSVPGRKALVHVSQGMPIRPWEELYQAVNDSFLQIRAETRAPRTLEEREADINIRSSALGAIDSSVSGTAAKDRGAGIATDLQELTALANTGQVTIYTIRPFTQSSGIPAEFAGSVSSFYTPSMKSTRDANLRETAQLLAESTGGISLAGSDLAEILNRAERDFRGYYSLAYKPREGRDPGFHEVRVKVKGRGRVVRHRQGFFEKPPQARFGDRASAALLFDKSENPLGLEIEIADIEPASGNQPRGATLRIIIPLEAVTLTPRPEGGWALDGDVYMTAADSAGGTTPVQLIPLQIPVDAASEAEARAERYGARMKIAVKSGEQRIAVGFVDRGSGVESYVARTFEVP